MVNGYSQVCSWLLSPAFEAFCVTNVWLVTQCLVSAACWRSTLDSGQAAFREKGPSAWCFSFYWTFLLPLNSLEVEAELVLKLKSWKHFLKQHWNFSQPVTTVHLLTFHGQNKPTAIINISLVIFCALIIYFTLHIVYIYQKRFFWTF